MEWPYSIIYRYYLYVMVSWEAASEIQRTVSCWVLEISYGTVIWIMLSPIHICCERKCDEFFPSKISYDMRLTLCHAVDPISPHVQHANRTHAMKGDWDNVHLCWLRTPVGRLWNVRYLTGGGDAVRRPYCVFCRWTIKLQIKIKIYIKNMNDNLIWRVAWRCILTRPK